MGAPVGQDRISRVVGYDLTGIDLSPSSPNLPQRIVVMAEANLANQGTLDVTKKVITSQKQAGQLYGYGSPIHMIMRILKPLYSDGVGGIPVVVIPQAEVGGSSARIMTITPVGVATKSGTHFLKIAGRTGIDGQFYALNILIGDTVAIIAGKINAAVNSILGCPMSSVSTPYSATLTTKWRGLTAQGITLSVDTGEDTLGLTYNIAQTTGGAGQPDIAAALAQMVPEWNTWVVNSYGTVTTIMAALEAFNGRPAVNDAGNATGRYVGTTWKPLVAVTGSVVDDPSSITDPRLDDLTIAIAPAPLSPAHQFEAAANMVVLASVIAQNSPELDVAGLSYQDMPAPTSIGSMEVYENRDAIVKKGCSTVNLVSGKYQVLDFVTTYHPFGEAVPQYRYVRNLVGIDFNFRYAYLLLEGENVLGKVIANDNDNVAVSNVIKPKGWKQLIYSLIDDLVSRALIVDASYSKSLLMVTISSTNPDRFDTRVFYKRSGTARISSTAAKAGFNYGTLN